MKRYRQGERPDPDHLACLHVIRRDRFTRREVHEMVNGQAIFHDGLGWRACESMTEAREAIRLKAESAWSFHRSETNPGHPVDRRDETGRHVAPCDAISEIPEGPEP